MAMRALLYATLLAFALPATGTCESCDALAGKLARLRNEYHKYATGDEAQKKLLTFDELASKLDEIIDVKKEMRQADCKIPSRSAALGVGKHSDLPDYRPKKTKSKKRGHGR